MEDGTGTDEIETFRGDETRGQDVEIVGDIIVDDSVAGIYIQLKKTSWSVTGLGYGAVQNFKAMQELSNIL